MPGRRSPRRSAAPRRRCACGWPGPSTGSRASWAWTRCRVADSLPTPPHPTVTDCFPPADRSERLVWLRADQFKRWQLGERPPVEAYLGRFPALADDEEGLLDLIVSEVMLRADCGAFSDVEEYVRRFPRLEGPLRRQF